MKMSLKCPTCGGELKKGIIKEEKLSGLKKMTGTEFTGYDIDAASATSA
jgi:PHP family Zn ribbon phosphoesterase